MKTTDFARYLTDYLSIYLPGQRNLSSHTIASYRDTFKLLLVFCEHEKGMPPESLTLAHMNDDLILAFMTWIETTRKCSIIHSVINICVLIRNVVSWRHEKTHDTRRRFDGTWPPG